MDLVALKNEIQNDPQSIGYSGKSHEDIAKLLNRPVRNVDRDTISGGQIAACLVKADWTALSAADKNYLQVFIAAQDMPLTIQLKNELGGLFGVGTGTRTNLLAMLKQSGSRAKELGLGSVTTSDVADALRS